MKNLCLHGTLCFGEQPQILKVGREMTIDLKPLPYDARFILFHKIVYFIKRHMLTSAAPLLNAG